MYTKIQSANSTYSLLACFTLLILLSKISEIYVFLGPLHLNAFFLFGTGLLLLLGPTPASTEFDKRSENRLILGLFFLAGLSIPFSVWPTGSLNFFKTVLLTNTILFFICSAAMGNRKQVSYMVYSFLAAVIILSISLHISPVVGGTGRVSVGMTYDPNDLALILAVSFPLFGGLFFISRTRGKWFALVGMLLVIIGILKTGSRGGFLALAIAVFLMLLPHKTIKIMLWHKAAVVIASAIIMFSSQGTQMYERWLTVFSGEDYNVANTEAGYSGRLAIWKSGIILAVENPITGVGVGQSSTAMGERYGQYGWKTMHNSYLQILLELGVMGLVVYCYLLKRIWCNCSEAVKIYEGGGDKSSNAMLAAMLKISLITYMIAGAFLSQAYSIVLVFFLALSNGISMISKEYMSAQSERE